MASKTRERTSRVAASDTAVITSSDLARIRAAADVARHDPAAVADRRETARAAQLARSQQQRQRLTAREGAARTERPKTETEELTSARHDDLRAAAALVAQESRDEVKRMNSMILYAKTAAIRDRQLAEKAEMKQAELEEERRQDTLMERDRRTALEREEDKDRRRAAASKSAAQEIEGQIREIAARRTVEEREREREREAVLRHMKAMEAEETERVQRKREEAERLKAQVKRGNDEQLRLKKERIAREKQEERLIEGYNERLRIEKDRLAREAEAVARQKERRKMAVFERQEQAINTLAARDELLARRAAEERERQWRENAKKDAARKAAARADLDAARQEQIREKKVKVALQARRDRADFERIRNDQLRQADRDQASRRVHTERKAAIAADLAQQVAEVEEAKRKQYREKFAEGEKLRARQAEEQRELERIKARKVQEIVGLGVPSKYVSELERAKIA
eukprot:TRINITY_DN185_c0_g2_i1.p2 TRINITY_DN185_c0_g2~~TRINITY_DN185_c0_g2_i1.p2  ORF type:complete len:487 (-),score=327.56 TRINITY_DN185_c0_g2_i1:46-1425(-)